MTTNYDDILKKLDNKLDILEIEEQDILLKAEKGIKLAKQTLKKVRSIIVDYEFETKLEEIHFFKCTKPKIYSKLIYYVKLFNIESKRPRGSNKSQVKYLNNYIEKLQTYFNDNLDFYHYYRREATVFDEQYFLRGKADIRLFPDSFHFFVDEEFATSHDSTVASILAYDLLIVHLKREIDKLENNGNYASLRLLQSKTKITWTAHKIYLIELIYALHSTDVINNGTVDIKDIAYFVEKTFKVDLGDYY
ncbi:RteC domain-containing protein, partial [uncultured Maribacter sp.]